MDRLALTGSLREAKTTLEGGKVRRRTFQVQFNCGPHRSARELAPVSEIEEELRRMVSELGGREGLDEMS